MYLQSRLIVTIFSSGIGMMTSGMSRSPVETINSMISGIGDKERNRINGVFLDETLMEFYQLADAMPVPPVPVSELDYTTGIEIVKSLILLIPEYLRGHSLLEKRKPSSEQHSLQFFKPVIGKIIDFVHILRFDFKLTGSDGRISGRGDNRTFPQYNTDRIRFRSRLVPVAKGSDPSHIDSLRMKSRLEVDTDGKRFTSVFFDEFSTSEISIDFSSKAGTDIYSVPLKIYQFIAYDYFTACLNIPDPLYTRLDSSAAIFEPLFFYLYFKYRERNHEIAIKELADWNRYLNLTETGVEQKILLHDQLKDNFSRYTIYRDDDLLLKGLRKILISE